VSEGGRKKKIIEFFKEIHSCGWSYDQDPQSKNCPMCSENLLFVWHLQKWQAGDELNFGWRTRLIMCPEDCHRIESNPPRGIFKGTSCCCVREWVKEDRQSKGMEHRKLEEKKEDTMIHELFAS
jgi:hypothetical protein